MANSAITGPTLIDFPAGMIMPYAGSTTPAGWLECDGTEKDITAYPTLAAALGTTWNTAKNPLTGANYAAPAAGKFRVPDMRGAFLRGSTGGANNAQGVATALAEFQTHKTAKNGLNATSTAPTFTGAAVTGGSATSGGVDHNHSFNHESLAALGGTGWTVMTGQTTGASIVSNASAYLHTHTVTATSAGSNAAPTITVGAGDAETRPDAVGVRYLIKF